MSKAAVLALAAILCLLPFAAEANPIFAPRIETVTSGDEPDPYLIDVKAKRRRKAPEDPCAWLRPIVTQVVGAQRAKCYMKLFLKETTCNAGEKQKKGQAGNPHAGYGVCTLEASLSIRRQNKRGPDCENIGDVVNQIKCCRAIMRKTPNYFGPVKFGKMAACN